MKWKVEDRIAANEKKYRAIADKFIDSLWVIDAKTLKYLYISQDTFKIRGYTQKETLGLSIEKTVTPESLHKTMELFAQAKKEFDQGIKKSHITEIEVYHKNGSTVWLEISAKFVKEPTESLKIVGITRNIDKRKTAELEREKSLVLLKESLKEKEQLLDKIKKLESLLPMCAGCRRIRDAHNAWWPLEKFIEDHAGSKFSHTICPECKPIYYPDL